MIKITSLRRITLLDGNIPSYGTEVLYTSDGAPTVVRFNYSIMDHTEAKRAIEGLRAKIEVRKCIS
jgi:hypothetical protein